MSTKLLTTAQVADMLGCSRALVVQWRGQPGRGPAFIRSGRYIRYRADDVDSWIESHREAA